jgi:hypothetical protein
MGETLAPVVRDLILRVLAAELAAPSANGPEARRGARDRARTLLDEWTELVRAQGVTAQPSFASEATRESAVTAQDEAETVREALLRPLKDEMWQLCAPDDLTALDVDAPTRSVRFASRLARGALRSLPGEEPVWMSAGKFSGVLRLVPLRAGITVQRWSEQDSEEDSKDPTIALEQ